MIDPPQFYRESGSSQSVTRRQFLTGVGVVLAGSPLLTMNIGTRVTRSASRTHLMALSRSTFAKHLGETFYILPETAAPLAVHLTRVRDLRSTVALGTSAMTSGYDEGCFSLVFRGLSTQVLAQDVYQFDHNQMGTCTLLITPLHPDEDARYYEAVFNSPPVWFKEQ